MKNWLEEVLSLQSQETAFVHPCIGALGLGLFQKISILGATDTCLTCGEMVFAGNVSEGWGKFLTNPVWGVGG